jgi:hypothetical protein
VTTQRTATPINLTNWEWKLAVHIGRLRQAGGEHLPNKHGARVRVGQNVEDHVLGAAGELAVAKALNIYPLLQVNVFKRLPDLDHSGQRIEVRARRSHRWDLIVRDDDDRQAVYVLATLERPYAPGNPVAVHGWMLGQEAMRLEWRRDRGGYGSPCYWVPQQHLNDIANLKARGHK